ncbi:hypothetical protein Mapa_001266 [Marchantia paleacea]|nr:hypothetical protein Mapa_001266 [Marchantia paleacea]
MESQGGGGLAQQQQHQVEVVVAGGGTEKRRERKKGGSGGLVLGIAAVVVVGVAGKLLQRFNSRSEAPSSAIVDTAAASDATESLDKVIAGEARSSDLLKKVVSPVAEADTNDRGSPPIQPSRSVEEKFIGCETPDLVESKGRSFDGNAEISDQDSCSGESSSSSSSSSGSSRKALIQVKLPLDKIVAAEEFEGQGISPKCQKGEPDLAAQTALAELVHQSVRYDVPSDEIIKTKNLQDDIADVLSRAFGDFGCGELAKEELAPTQVTFQVVWEEKPEPEDADVADTADSENPVHCDAQDNSEGFTSQSESGSESANVRSDFMDACDTDPAPAGDEVEMEFLNAEAQMEDIRINPELSEPECKHWPQATTSNELISSVPGSPSAEIKAQAPEDVPASAVSEALASFSTVPHLDEDFEPADRDYYFAREDSSAALDEAQDDAEDGVGECQAYEDSREEAEGIIREGETPSSKSLQDEAKHIAIAREKNLTVEVTAERQEDEDGEGEEETESESSTESLKQMEPAILERFEELLCSSNADTTSTPSSSVDAKDAETGTDGVDEAEEGSAASTSDEELVVKITTQIIPAREEGCCEITAAKEVGAAEVTDQSGEAAPESDEEEAEEEDDEKDTIVKVKSSVVLPSSTCSPNNATRGSSSSRGNLKTKSAVITTMEFTSPSLATRKGGNFKQESSRDRFPSEILRMAFLVALIAAIVLMLREHMKPLKHAS